MRWSWLLALALSCGCDHAQSSTDSSTGVSSSASSGSSAGVGSSAAVGSSVGASASAASAAEAASVNVFAGSPPPSQSFDGAIRVGPLKLRVPSGWRTPDASADTGSWTIHPDSQAGVWIRPLDSKLLDDRAAFQREARSALVGYLEMSFGPPTATKVGDTPARVLHGHGVARGAGERCRDKVPPLSCHRPVELWAIGVRLDDARAFMINVRIDRDASEALRKTTFAAVQSAQVQNNP